MTPLPEPPIHGFRFPALGGEGRLRLAGLTRPEAERTVIGAVQWLRRFEARFSRFVPASLVSRLNRGETVEPDPELRALLAFGDQARRATGGRVNVAALPLWACWHDPCRLTEPSPAEIAAARDLTEGPVVVEGPDGLRLARPCQALDFGGFGKEWCVDQLVALLERQGRPHFLVELAGDVAARGCASARDEGWWVLLPGMPRALSVRNAALATSGHRARHRMLAGRRVSHLIDARSGQPASGRIAFATVLAARCVEAGLAARDAALADDVDAAWSRCQGKPFLLRTSDGRTIGDSTFAIAGAPVGEAPSPARCAAA